MRLKADPNFFSNVHWDEVNAADTVEVYSPPYSFFAGRPRITSTALADMNYGVEYHIKVNDPTKVDYAVLMGTPAVTHHFDYGQRYVELMTQELSPPDVNGNNLRIMPPAEAWMAPEGPYLLFVVDKIGSVRLPSPQGRFLKVRMP